MDVTAAITLWTLVLKGRLVEFEMEIPGGTAFFRGLFSEVVEGPEGCVQIRFERLWRAEVDQWVDYRDGQRPLDFEVIYVGSGTLTRQPSPRLRYDFRSIYGQKCVIV